MVSRQWTKSAILAIPCLIVSCLSVGCVGRFTGGGSIDSVAGAPQKATFGFVINAVEPDENGNPTAVTGQFDYFDHGTGVRFHVDQFAPALYARVYPNIFNPLAVIFAYSGTYSCPAGTGTLDLGVASDQQGIFGVLNNDAVYVHGLSAIRS